MAFGFLTDPQTGCVAHPPDGTEDSSVCETRFERADFGEEDSVPTPPARDGPQLAQGRGRTGMGNPLAKRLEMEPGAGPGPSLGPHQR